MLNRLFVSSVRSGSNRLFSTAKKPLVQITATRNKIVAINSSVKINKCEMIDGNQTKNECYILMHELRKEDIFQEGLSKEKMIQLFFPNTSKDMALSLSNVTS